MRAEPKRSHRRLAALPVRIAPAADDAAVPVFGGGVDDATRPCYLQRERPQTIAVVISHLSSDRAAEVLALLPAELQGDVALRLVHLDKTDPEILDEIERGMQSWISQQGRTPRAHGAGLETLRGVHGGGRRAGRRTTSCATWLSTTAGWPANLPVRPGETSRLPTWSCSTTLRWPMSCDTHRPRSCCWPWRAPGRNSSAACCNSCPPTRPGDCSSG